VVGQVPLGAADAAARAPLEGLGFAVELREDALVKATDAAGRALVVVSSSVQSTDVGNRLTDVATPLVAWEPSLFDDLRLTGLTENSDYGSTPDVVEVIVDKPAHPIAENAGLSGGALTAVTTKDRFSWAKPLATADIVASFVVAHQCGCDTRAAVFAYEKGDALAAGAVAPARRVGLFLNNDTGTRLTAAGWKLFDSAILWAAGDACTTTTWYVDVDGDGFGDASTAKLGCVAPAGGVSRVAQAGDCNDTQDSVHPGAPERCDGVDQDCNGVTDDHPVDGYAYYWDLDGDGYGDAAHALRICSTMPPAHAVVNDDDCNDANPAIRPGVPEVAGNAVDENCDGDTP
jgi:hypothetical protein